MPAVAGAQQLPYDVSPRRGRCDDDARTSPAGLAVSMRQARWLCAVLLLRAEGASAQCTNSAGDDNCASYVSAVSGTLSHCETALKTGLRVEDVCAQRCGRCGTLLEANAEAACFPSEYTPRQPFFSNCCQTVLNFPEASSGANEMDCTTADCGVCWGNPVVPGVFETCCIDQDPCRHVDCGQGTCFSSGSLSTCHCEPGWIGADGKEGRETGAVAPYCNTWNGFHTAPAVRRVDAADGNLYTRDQFLLAYSQGSNEWDSAAGLEGVCWDATYTYARCCAPLDGVGDTSCWFGDITYANCLCANLCASLDCGAHGTCNAATGVCVCLAGYSGANCESWEGHKLKGGAEARQDLADGNYYTRAEFDAAYGAASESRWNAQVGQVQVCWDSTFTYNRCCSPLDGNGDASCWLGDTQYASCQCDPPVDCVGAWSECRSDCSSVFAVTTEATGNGLECEAADGAKRGCSSGTGDCQLCESSSGSRTGYSIPAAAAASSTVGGLKGQFLCLDGFLSRVGADAQAKCESLQGCTYTSSTCTGVPTASALSCQSGFSGTAAVACPSDSTQFQFSGCDENSCAAIVMGTGVVADSSSGDGCTAGLQLTTTTDTSCDIKCDTTAYVAQAGTVTCLPNAAAGDAATSTLSC
eukprot:COSAG03_NODE_3065_length_2252_cov_1.942406_1_plen_640_part_01